MNFRFQIHISRFDIYFDIEILKFRTEGDHRTLTNDINFKIYFFDD